MKIANESGFSSDGFFALLSCLAQSKKLWLFVCKQMRPNGHCTCPFNKKELGVTLEVL